MWSLGVVGNDVLLQNRLDLAPANQQEIVQRLSSHRPEEPFHDTVHVRRLDSRFDGYQIVRKEVDIEHSHIVMNQLGFAGNGLAEEYQLLPNKFSGRILSDSTPDNLPRFV